ncbi:MAG: hypothetical protein ACI9YH_004238 [Colwellia sp.]|jgi:hypothetical protein
MKLVSKSIFGTSAFPMIFNSTVEYLKSTRWCLVDLDKHSQFQNITSAIRTEESLLLNSLMSEIVSKKTLAVVIYMWFLMFLERINIRELDHTIVPAYTVIAFTIHFYYLKPYLYNAANWRFIFSRHSIVPLVIAALIS